VIAYPEIEHLPEAKRKQWLVSRWVGLTQPERVSFRAALDAADATRAEHSIVSQRLTRALARSDTRLTRAERLLSISDFRATFMPASARRQAVTAPPNRC
jgi:hypothetical protein